MPLAAVLMFNPDASYAQTFTQVGSDSVAENAGTYSFIIRNSTSGTLTNVSWTTSNGTARAGSDYTYGSGNAGILGTGADVRGTITILNDDTQEDAETFNIVVIGTPVGGTQTFGTFPITIEKNDQPPASLSISPNSNVQITEGSTQNFTVTLSPAQAQEVTVKCKSTDGTAVAPGDYTAVDETLTFAANETTKTCSLATIDNNVSEDAEDLTFGLADAAGGPTAETDGSGGLAIASGSDSFTVSILDNDQPASTLTFPDGAINVAEGAGTADVRVNLASNRPIIENVTVRCQAAASSATAGEDFTAVDQLLTFAPSDIAAGATTTNVTKTCSIPIADDDLDESQEQISVSLADPTGGATLPSSPSVNVTIMDNDDPPTVWVAVAEATVSEGTATYDITVNMSASTGKSVIALGYRLSGTATPGYDDRLTPPEVGEDYTVSYSRAGGSFFTAKTVVGTENFAETRLTTGLGQIILFPGETEKTFTIHVNDDQLKEVDETIIFELRQSTDPNNPFVNGTTRSNLEVDQNRKTTTLTLQSDDGGAVNLSWLLPGEPLDVDVARNINDENVPEGERGNDLAIQFRVSMDVVSPPTDIGLTVRSGTATEGEDYELTTVSPTLGHIGPSQGFEWYVGFRITIKADDEREGDEYFEVVVDDTAGNLLAEPFQVTIEDDYGSDPILGETARHSIARAEAMLENQPRLIPMLRDPDDRSEFSLRVTEGGVAAAGGGFQAETVWGATALSRSVDGGSEHEHLLATLGAHFRTSERLHLGGMLQFDRSDMKVGGQGASGEIGGSGWMAGPYFAARDASQPLFFEGRLLYGRTSNDVDALVLSEGDDARNASFDGERWLAQARVEGTYRLGNGATLIPLADLGHVRDELEPFQDGDGARMAGQTISLTKLQIGAELEIPVETARGDLRLTPGLRFVASDATGGALAGEDDEAGLRSRGRIDFGIDYRLDGGLVLGFDGFYSGLGRKELESYGAGLDLRLEF